MAKIKTNIKQISREQSTINVGMGMMFLFAIWAAATILTDQSTASHFIVAAAVIGGYMALNIGANDVANNIGPAVGSKALTMGGALVIAAIFEAAGALLAGGDVVNTISKGIIDPAQIADSTTFVWAMMSALLAAALWLNLATWIGAPVSTTHSIVGGITGAGIAAAGMEAVNWPQMASIAASWVISPVLGGVIAALFLSIIKRTIFDAPDKIEASKKWVPIMVGILAAAFAVYLGIKGLKHIWRPDLTTISIMGAIGFISFYIISRPLVIRGSAGLENRNKSVNKLFTVPLIASAALLSFAHGANDVANAVGPLAAIVSAVSEGAVASKVSIPLWVMLIGAMGISVGLFLFGPKLIRTVGQKITRLDQVRAFCVALSAAITVIAASWMGLPVSSTHIAVGGVFGVGFLREFLINQKVNNAWKANGDKSKKKLKKRKLVRRKHLTQIVTAWIITVPFAAVLAGGIFYIFTHVNME